MYRTLSISKLFKHLLFGFFRFHAAENEGGGATPPVITPEIQALIDQKLEAATAGLKNKNSELLGKLKETGESLKRFDGIDPDAVRNILSKFASDEEAGLIAKGDIDTVLSKRTERMQADFNKKLESEQKERNRYVEANKKLSARAMSESILKAATKAGALPEAMEDIVLRARGTFTVNEDGDVVAMNGDEVVLGKDGKTALSPIEWAESLRENAPHLWPKAQGTNAPGSGQHGKAAQDYSNLSPSERMTKAREAGNT